MTYVVIDSSGMVIHCVSVDDLQSLHECYPDCIIAEQVGAETIGWTFDGVGFTSPQG